MIYNLDLSILRETFRLEIAAPYSQNLSLNEMLSSLTFQTQHSFIPEMASAMQANGPQEVSEKGHTVVIDSRTKRNEPCPCGSGKKHKKCCGEALLS